MAYALLRVFYGIWMMGFIGFAALAIGTTAFSAYGWRTSTKVFLRRILHALIWPVALLSSRGRDRLLTDLQEGQK